MEGRMVEIKRDAQVEIGQESFSCLELEVPFKFKCISIVELVGVFNTIPTVQKDMLCSQGSCKSPRVLTFNMVRLTRYSCSFFYYICIYLKKSNTYGCYTVRKV